MFNRALIFFFVFSNYICFSQNTFIPDDNFEQALINLGYDVGPLDDFVPTTNIRTVTNLDLNFLNISDLTGIEDFRDLSIFDCSRNQLSTINVTQNANLTQLYCHGNQFTSIDVTQNSILEVLWCYINLLPDIDVTQNPNLISLVCWDNNLTSLDVSNNQEIVVLGCEINQITSLDLSNNPKLTRFQCRDNLLTELDVSNNPSLTFMDCGDNQISTLDLSSNPILRTFLCAGNNLETLDLTQNPNLLNFDCSNNQLCALNVKNGTNDNITFFDFNNNPRLNCVVVDNSSGDHSLWEPTSFTNYVNSPNNCGNFIPLDTIEDFIGSSFTLPVLNNGNYFTESGGMGTPLNAGDVITTNQTIYIYNESGCNSNESSFTVLINTEDYFIPKYFTPNNDGEHDFWKVIDNTGVVNNISIYNRYGKLLKFLNSNSQGWDGTFNGNLLPTDSYWYEMVLNNNEIIRGYFALKR